MDMDINESDSSENDEMSDDEVEEPGPPVACLFCTSTTDSISQSIEHIKADHSFNIERFLTENVSSTYDLIKIITYIRSKKVSPSELEASKRLWDSEEYLKPLDTSDPWLWTDFDFIDDIDSEPKYVNSENGVITLSKEHFDQLQKRNQELEKLVEEKDRQMDKLRNLLNEADSTESGDRPGDNNYFSSYSSFDIHREMLGDVPRMEAFKQLFNQKSLFQEKSVLDVGCGTGILSMMAASAGASQVVGVDDSDILYSAIEIIQENNFDHVIKLVKSSVEKVQLENQFDVIVSEWMGYFLLFEGMLSSILIARDRFLKPGGLMFPSSCSIWLAGVSDPSGREERLPSTVCGFKMSPLTRAALSEASVETVRPENIATQPVHLHTIQMLTAQQEDCYFSLEFRLSSIKDCVLTSLCGWFDSKFEPTDASLSTSPFSPETHWKQTQFFLEEVVPLKTGEHIDCKISVEPPSQGSRSLVVNITIKGHQQTFTIQ